MVSANPLVPAGPVTGSLCTGFASTVGLPSLAWLGFGTTSEAPHSRAGSRHRPSGSPLPAVRTYVFLFRRGGRVHAGAHAGTLGFVAINNADDAWSTTFSTGLPTGSYCNVFEGTSKGGTCSGSSYVRKSQILVLFERQSADLIHHPMFGFADSRSVSTAS
jgi:hypothetical protein